MSYSDYKREEIAEKGKRIYEEQLRPMMNSEDHGKFIIIDIETGDYELDESDVVATQRALDKNPDAVLFGMRVGYPASYRIGAAFRAGV
jgi:hypothetical protein